MTATVSHAAKTEAPPRTAAFRLLAACLTWLGVAAAATVIGVAERWPNQFAGEGDPSKIASQWVTNGTVLSPPLFVMIALIVGLALTALARRKGARIAGAVIAVVVGLLATVFSIGEAATAATTLVPRGAHLGALIGTVLSLAVVVTGIWFVRSTR